MLFTTAAGLSVLLLSLALIAILGPMVVRGASAVVFKGTVEFREMQLALFDRGNPKQIEKESAKAREYRAKAYEILDDFKHGVDREALSDRVREIHRQFGRELRTNNVPTDEYSELRSITRKARNLLEEAFESDQIETVREKVMQVLEHKSDPRFADTVAAELFTIAEEYLATAQEIDLSKQSDYAEQVAHIEDILTRLLGPRPGTEMPALVRMRYGATRWDQARDLLDELMWTEKWVQTEPGKPLLQKVRASRSEQFAGTKLENLFGYVDNNLEQMLHPQTTFYWQYFIDDSYNSHYFGGVGPEIVGTILLTLLGMVFVIPLGIISAAYLAECASDNLVVRIIRMCINTLAGVPSIVFGLFGLAFFILFVFPAVGLPSKACILAGSLTLAVLTLPVMIRASEEAIRTVPQTYKEASLALGAGAFRTFMTVTLPAALPGILTGVILSLSRIAGETAPILFTAAVALGPVPQSLLDPTRTLSYGSYDMAVGDRVAMMVPHKQYGMVVTLIALILALNGIAIVLRGRAYKKLRGH